MTSEDTLFHLHKQRRGLTVGFMEIEERGHKCPPEIQADIDILVKQIDFYIAKHDRIINERKPN